MGSFADRRKQAEKDGLLGKGDYLKLKEGANRFRLMTECLPHPGSYQGRNNFKWLAYILDRSDGVVKPFFMPHTIYKQIEALQGSEDYAFDEEPMPYDVTVNAVGAGTKEVKYTVIPARANKPLTVDEEAALLQAKPLKELQAALKEKREKDELPSERSEGDENHARGHVDDDSWTPF